MPTGEFEFKNTSYWASDVKFVSCQEIGEANERQKKCVILAAGS